MKYKINNYLVDAKSPEDAVKAYNAVAKCKDSISEVVKQHNFKITSKTDGCTVCKPIKSYDAVKAHKLACILQDKGYKATVNAPNVVIKDATCKDTTPIDVEAIPYKNSEYVVLEYTYHNDKYYLVVAKENYHNETRYTGGGIVEFSLSAAKKTADDFEKMNDKSYKKWMSTLDAKCKDAYLIQLKEDKDVYWQEDNHFGRSKHYAKRFDTYEEAKTKANAVVSGWPYVVNIVKDSVKDDAETEYLSQEEEQAIEDYKKAIANTKDVKLLKIYAHILKEETEHLEELQNEEVTDACKTKDYATPYAIWVKEKGKWLIWGGSNSTNVDKQAFLKQGYEDVKVVENGQTVHDEDERAKLEAELESLEKQWDRADDHNDEWSKADIDKQIEEVRKKLKALK